MSTSILTDLEKGTGTNDLSNNVKTEFTKYHETDVLDFFGYEVEIDRNISQLIQELWNADILTTNSCEDNVPKGYVWIEFESPRALEKFMDIIFLGENFENDVFERSISGYDHPGKKWKFKINISGDDDELDNGNNIVKIINIYPSVRFPQEDTSYVYEKIKKFNSKQ
ncbi:MAG: hypothetical protein Harvfovirus10_19 [Harvfovirus sp.]|uniref:Uncharacterized protein n=1 Tax=Harvfovirus sp. TaxID=2487768 RepID=A0A3G5A3Y2_9VIRU|nr:MAG: hypothetical protein Harvfovirus10_19 [Harvfovirus sp.]